MPVPAQDRTLPTPRNAGAPRLRGALREFLHGERGAAALESAVALTVLVVGFAALMAIVREVYVDDRAARAARAAARALALDPTAHACAAIRRELRLADDFDCETAWTLKVDLGVGPGSLPDTLEAEATAGSGDIVLVRIGRSRDRLSPGGLVEDADHDGGDAPAVMVAMGLARCEVELCGQGTP